ncbi:MAG: carbohydrate ABC transporter permease [Chloroflexi bacterium]|nr:carbohydrate ABC transporter permease [Chloroflexota bacterium]
MAELAVNEVGRGREKTALWPQTLSGRRLLGHGALHLALVAAGITFLVPFFWVVSTSFKLPGKVFTYPIKWIPDPFMESNYPDMLRLVEIAGRPGMLVFAQNTMIIAVLATLGTLVSCAFVAYSFARLRWPERDLAFSACLATMMLPGVVTLVPTFLIFRDLHWLDTLLPLIVPPWFGINGFYVFLMRQSFLGLPYELEEAARVDGASSLRILWQIMMPLSGPTVATVAIFSFLHHYNDFMGPMIYLSSNRNYTLSLGLYMVQGRYGTNWPMVMAASTVVILPPLIVFFLAQRYFIRGIQLSGIAGR